jgi:hypothetical protein
LRLQRVVRNGLPPRSPINDVHVPSALGNAVLEDFSYVVFSKRGNAATVDDVAQMYGAVVDDAADSDEQHFVTTTDDDIDDAVDVADFDGFNDVEADDDVDDDDGNGGGAVRNEELRARKLLMASSPLVVSDRRQWARVVGVPERRKRVWNLPLCTADGEWTTRAVSKSHAVSGGFRLAKKTKWGDLWPYVPFDKSAVPAKAKKVSLLTKRQRRDAHLARIAATVARRTAEGAPPPRRKTQRQIKKEKRRTKQNRRVGEDASKIGSPYTDDPAP